MIAVSSQRSPIIFGDEVLREWRKLCGAELARPGCIVIRVPELIYGNILGLLMNGPPKPGAPS